MTFKEKNIKKTSKNLNLHKKPNHVRFDDSDELVAVKPSCALSKVKNFLTSAKESQAKNEDIGKKTEFSTDEGSSTPKVTDDFLQNFTLPPDVEIVSSDSSEDEESITTDANTVISTTNVPVDVEAESPIPQVEKVKKWKKNKKRRKFVSIPPEIMADQELQKYWFQRYRLFSKFDEGIKMDRGITFY